MSATQPIVTVCALVIILGMSGCAGAGNTPGKEQGMTYAVNRLDKPIEIDANWDKPAWKAVQPVELTHFMGDRPEHLPKTQAKLLYDDRAIYVIFRVEDRYVRAVAENHQDSVCRDSCAEFFFVPGMDPDAGYFNLEMNCGGTMLFNFQVVPRKDMTPLTSRELDRIDVAHSMPRIVDPEVTEPTTWTVEYRMPIDILADYRPGVVKPAPGVTWRANFYKCADRTSHPHWLTWSLVDKPRPDFHVPEYFGTLAFK